MLSIIPKAGDILLMMSRDELSKLIAWFGDSPYSHSALMVTDQLAMESIAIGITKTKLIDFVKPDFKVKYLDVFRSLNRNGNTLSIEQIAAVRAAAEAFEGIPFEFGKLVQIGVLAAVRQKIPKNPIARRLVRIAFDYILENHESAMTCSQFVYTSFLKASRTIGSSVLPRITVVSSNEISFPDDIDWPKLLIEIKALFPAQIASSEMAWASDELKPFEMNVLSDEAIQQKARKVLLVLGFSNPLEREALCGLMNVGDIIPNPNPKLVTPEDLHCTPDHHALGRWFEF
jgi:hypothetical protein